MEEQKIKNKDIYTFEDGRVSVAVEIPDTISLLTSETLARIDYRKTKLNELLMGWVNREGVNKLHQTKTQIEALTDEEFKILWDQAHYWTLNIYNSELTPTFEQFFRDRMLPSKEIVSRQFFWNRLISVENYKKASPEQIEKLQRLRDQETQSHVIQSN
jgi:hypothetical protein